MQRWSDQRSNSSDSFDDDYDPRDHSRGYCSTPTKGESLPTLPEENDEDEDFSECELEKETPPTKEEESESSSCDSSASFKVEEGLIEQIPDLEWIAALRKFFMSEPEPTTGECAVGEIYTRIASSFANRMKMAVRDHEAEQLLECFGDISWREKSDGLDSIDSESEPPAVSQSLYDYLAEEEVEEITNAESVQCSEALLPQEQTFPKAGASPSALNASEQATQAVQKQPVTLSAGARRRARKAEEKAALAASVVKGEEELPKLEELSKEEVTPPVEEEAEVLVTQPESKANAKAKAKAKAKTKPKAKTTATPKTQTLTPANLGNLQKQLAKSQRILESLTVESLAKALED